jgi:hypothetical protein
MLDRRARIIASLIVLLGAGAYVLWITRSRAKYEARSLSAAQRPPGLNPNIGTRTLHVEGCAKDFIVKTGELVEPRVVPGVPLERFRNIYGKETKHVGNQTSTWSLDAFSLTESDYAPESLGNNISISVNQGHVVQTLDDIELGLDSMGTLFRKMRDRKIEVHERIDGAEGNWMLTISFFSACGRKYRSEYSVVLPGTPQIEDSIRSQVNGPQAAGKSLNSDIFLNKVIYSYLLVPSGGKDESTDGNPSEHH